jgi:tRNA-2-methylthio-N6-dimethylallyladenosine synthase
LLRRLAAIPGVWRLRFLTSHPVDMSEELVQTVAQVPQVMEYLHFPIQAGSDRILKEMKRLYTVDQYRDKVEMIRRHIPDAAISGDLIVGFPGETEEDFQETLRIVEEIEFDSNNTAAYSVRPYTPAGRREDQIDEQVKADRLQRLNLVVQEVALRCNRRLVGTKQEILVEGPSTRNPEVMVGRTRGNKICYFDGNKDLTGKLVLVEITEARSFTLKGEFKELVEMSASPLVLSS